VKRRNSDLPFILIFFFIVFLIPAEIRAQVTFTAQVSDHRVVQNGVFDIQFELSNAQGANFEPPSFTDFRVVAGPSQGQSTTIINGEMTSSQSYSYSLLATKKGKFTIGPATIVAGRKRLTTVPITIEVVQGKELVQKGSESQPAGDVLLVAETDKKDYYPGEQIILNYRILFNQNIQSLDILSEDDYADFFVQNFADFSKQPSIVKINNKEFTSRIIKSIALFPHQSGTFQLDPLVMSVGINTPFAGMQGFFNMRRMQEMKVSSDPVTINVLPLPDNAPPSFRGAVGQYALKTFPGSENITTDDALTFQIELHGNGDAKRWDPPIPVIDTSFESYDPKILDDQQTESGGAIDHRRNIEYQLIPKKAGQYSVYVPFTYFDPDAKRFVTISSDTLNNKVAQGTSAGRNLATVDDDELDKFEIEPVRNSIFSDWFWTSWPHLFLFGLLVTGSCWGLIFTAKAKKEGRISDIEKLKNAAVSQAVLQLDELLQQSSALDSKTFFEKATEIYYRFLCERLVIPPSDLEETQLPVYLQRAGVSHEITDRVNRLYAACLPVRYGGAPAGYSREEFVGECKEIISKL
jgi:hypothetical protein